MSTNKRAKQAKQAASAKAKASPKVVSEGNAKVAAKAAKAVEEANRLIIVGFDEKVVMDCFRHMAAGKEQGEKAQAEKANAALALCQHADKVAHESREAGATEIDKAWSANLKKLYPQMAKEGLPFIKVKETDDKTTYSLTGYGMNVNSVARGFCQYDDIDTSECESFGQCRTVVQGRRAFDLSPEARGLNAAKEALTAAWKDLRKLACKDNDQELIENVTLQIVMFHDELDAIVNAPEAETVEADADAIAA